MQTEDLKPQLTCAMCLDILRKPKSLSCLHSFCQSCLNSLIDATRSFDSIKCPTCRQVTELSDGIESLPTDFFKVQLIESLGLKPDFPDEEIPVNDQEINQQNPENDPNQQQQADNLFARIRLFFTRFQPQNQQENDPRVLERARRQRQAIDINRPQRTGTIYPIQAALLIFMLGFEATWVLFLWFIFSFEALILLLCIYTFTGFGAYYNKSSILIVGSIGHALAPFITISLVNSDIEIQVVWVVSSMLLELTGMIGIWYAMWTLYKDFPETPNFLTLPVRYFWMEIMFCGVLGAQSVVLSAWIELIYTAVFLVILMMVFVGTMFRKTFALHFGYGCFLGGLIAAVIVFIVQILFGTTKHHLITWLILSIIISLLGFIFNIHYAKVIFLERILQTQLQV